MCRMILAIGSVSLKTLLLDLSVMALDKNSVHEHNQEKGQGSWMHSDGWGIACLVDGKWIVHKSALPVYADSSLDAFSNLKPQLAILHVRRQSKGNVCLNNTHPFVEKNNEGETIAFAHNGTILNDPSFSQSYTCKGETDSEKLFYSLLCHGCFLTPTIIGEHIRRYPSYGGSNVILASPTTSIVSVNYYKNPRYYRMAYLSKPSQFIVSSEILSSFKEEQWEFLEDGKLLAVNNNTLKVSSKNVLTPYLTTNPLA